MEHYVWATIGCAITVGFAWACERYFGLDPLAFVAGAALFRAFIADSKAGAA